MHGWLIDRALHFKGSVQDESLEIHKQKESDGRKIKRGRWAVKELHARAGEVSSFLPIISCFLADHNSIYTFTISHGITLPLPTLPWCGDRVPVHLHLTTMACTSTPLWVHVYLAHTHTHIHAHKCTHVWGGEGYAAIWWDDMGLDRLVTFSATTMAEHPRSLIPCLSSP